MNSLETKMKIQVLTGNHLIPQEELPKAIYKSLSIKQKLRRDMNIVSISKMLEHTRLIYQPIWIAKLSVIASRKPFPPKITPNMAFIDAVTGYRGLLTNVPSSDIYETSEKELIKPKILSRKLVMDYVKDVQQKQINRMYMLKKPEHETKDISLYYLPLWKITLNLQRPLHLFLLNAYTGEAEKQLLNSL